MVMMNKKSANRGFDCFQKGFLGQGVHCGTLEILNGNAFDFCGMWGVSWQSTSQDFTQI